MGNLFATKPIDKLIAESREVGEHSLKRSLGPMNLIALGIGAIIGAGLFVRTAAAIADRAGPSVVLAFVVAGIGCTFAGLCYAEFASMIPLAGSAYTYSYATMGELVAWIIGWDLILEYAVAAATVAIAWSEYANRVLEWFGMRIPVSVVPFSVREGSRNRSPRHHERPLRSDSPRSYPSSHPRHKGIGHGQRDHRDSEDHNRRARHHHWLGIHQSGKPYAVHSGPHDLRDSAGNSSRLWWNTRHPRRGGRRVLCLHRL